MSDLLRLRHLVLVALGLPTAALACGEAPLPDVPEKPVVRRPDPTAVAPLDAACTDPGWVCARDQSGAGCGPDASDQTYHLTKGELRGQPWVPDAPETLAALRFDAEGTKKAREAVGPNENPGDVCCFTGCPVYREGAAEAAVPSGHHEVSHCVPYPAKTAFPAKEEARCPAALDVDGTLRPLDRFDAEKGNCCYETALQRGGRPLREDGAFTSVTSRDVPARPETSAIDVSRYDHATRARLAAHWHEAALVEHASVAAFSKISLELLAFGAPAELVRDAHQAAIDELAHADLCSRIAATFGHHQAPGAHAAAARVVPHTDLAAFVRETIEDGCVGESIAALEAAHAARETDDPTLKQAHATIASDESRHAALAFRIVAWARAVDPSMATAIDDALDALEMRADARDVVRDLVRPCLAA